MKVRIECDTCHVELPLTKAWKEEMERPEMMARDIEVISHGICRACALATYEGILTEDEIDYIINDNE